jgi:hypothetical protein
MASLTAARNLCLSLSVAIGACSTPPKAPSSPAPPSAQAESQAAALVPFASDEGISRLARATAKVDFPSLANQFEPQYNGAFCGPATAAIVLNAWRGRSPELPRDRGRLRPEDLAHLPPTVDLTLPRYTQDNVLERSPKPRAQVLGEPVTINGKQVKDFGFQTRQLDGLLKAHGAATKLVIVDDMISEEHVRSDLVGNLKQASDYAIVAYRRRDVGQQGGGHISPVAAFDAGSDSFLILDVNPASAGWVWMPTAVLVKGMRTFDTVENRGYILVQGR